MLPVVNMIYPCLSYNNGRPYIKWAAIFIRYLSKIEGYSRLSPDSPSPSLALCSSSILPKRSVKPAEM